MPARPAAPFAVSATRSGDDVVVLLDGDLDLHTAPRLRSTVEEALAAGPGVRRLVLELADVRFVDSSGLGAMLASKRLAEGADAVLLLRHPSDRLQQMLHITGLDRILVAG